MNSYLFKNIVVGKEGLLKGPFGSDLKKELYVKKSDKTYKVYLQENILKKSNEVGGHYISSQYYEEKMKRYTVKEGDFIVTCDGTLGEIFQLKNLREKGIISSSLLRITLNNNLVNDDYFYYYFKYYIKNKLIKSGNNSVLKHLPNIDVIRNLELSFPSMKEQEKVGNVLSTIDSKIENNNKIIQELENMAKDIYNYWFLQFDFPNEEGMPYKSSGGKMVWNDELKKEIPEGWEVKKVKDLTNVITGKEDANFSSTNGKYKFFTCSNDILKCDFPKFNGSSILIAGNGDFNVKHYTGEFNAYQRTYVLIPDDINNYCTMYFSILNKVSSFKVSSNGSIVKFITKGAIEDIDIIISKEKYMLDEINNILFAIEHSNFENEHLSSLRDFLLPLLMNGQVSIEE